MRPLGPLPGQIPLPGRPCLIPSAPPSPTGHSVRNPGRAASSGSEKKANAPAGTARRLAGSGLPYLPVSRQGPQRWGDYHPHLTGVETGTLEGTGSGSPATPGTWVCSNRSQQQSMRLVEISVCLVTARPSIRRGRRPFHYKAVMSLSCLSDFPHVSLASFYAWTQKPSPALGSWSTALS